MPKFRKGRCIFVYTKTVLIKESFQHKYHCAKFVRNIDHANQTKSYKLRNPKKPLKDEFPLLTLYPYSFSFQILKENATCPLKLHSGMCKLTREQLMNSVLSETRVFVHQQKDSFFY